jgi:hypothetical protein
MDPLLTRFLVAAMEDPRITVVHISLYLALWHQWYEQGSRDPLQVFSWEVMPWCKISGTATYHRCIRELDTYGYIHYVPSYNHHRGSRIYITALRNHKPTSSRTEAF